MTKRLQACRTGHRLWWTVMLVAQSKRADDKTRSSAPRALLKHVKRHARGSRRRQLLRGSAFACGHWLWFRMFLKLAAVNSTLAQIHFKVGGTNQRPLNQGLAQRILDVLLQGAPQGPRAIAAVGTGLFENILRGVVLQLDADLLRGQVLVDLLDQQLRDLQQIVVAERSEENGLIEAVQKLRIERLFHFRHHLVFHLLLSAGRRREAHRAALV